MVFTLLTRESLQICEIFSSCGLQRGIRRDHISAFPTCLYAAISLFVVKELFSGLFQRESAIYRCRFSVSVEGGEFSISLPHNLGSPPLLAFHFCIILILHVHSPLQEK